MAGGGGPYSLAKTFQNTLVIERLIKTKLNFKKKFLLIVRGRPTLGGPWRVLVREFKKRIADLWLGPPGRFLVGWELLKAGFVLHWTLPVSRGSLWLNSLVVPTQRQVGGRRPRLRKEQRLSSSLWMRGRGAGRFSLHTLLSVVVFRNDNEATWFHPSREGSQSGSACFWACVPRQLLAVRNFLFLTSILWRAGGTSAWNWVLHGRWESAI